jgi:hypothetical protein
MSEAAVQTSAHTGLQPRVVTGEAYNTLVEACKAGGYALPAVNTSSSHTINAVFEAAAKDKSNVIIQLSKGKDRRGAPCKQRTIPVHRVEVCRCIENFCLQGPIRSTWCTRSSRFPKPAAIHPRTTPKRASCGPSGL